MSDFKVTRRPGKIQLVNDTDPDSSDKLDVIAETDGTTITVNKPIDSSSLTLDGAVTVDGLTIAADSTTDALETNKDTGYTGQFIDFKLNGSNRLSLSSGGTMTIPGTMIAGAISAPAYTLSGSQYFDANFGLGNVFLGTSAVPAVAALAAGVVGLSFDPSSDEEMYFNYRLPNDYVSGTDIIVYVFWSPGGTSTNNFVMACDVTPCVLGGGVGATQTLSATVAGGGTADAWSITGLGSVTGTSITKQDMLSCRFFRNADDGSDTSADELQLGYVILYYRVDRLIRT